MSLGIASYCALAALCAPLAIAEVIRAAPGEFQQAIDRAKPGDTIELTAGARYTGNFVLPPKEGSGYIAIQSSAIRKLPPAGVRVKPSDAPNMPEIMTPNSRPAIEVQSRAHHYQLTGLNLRTFPGATNRRFVFEVVALGTGRETTLAELAHDIAIDRCYIHANPREPAKRGISLNSASTSILNSYIAGFKSTSQDTQAIAGWNGPGPYKVINNYLEAAGENIMFGGATVLIPGMVPSDIEIKRNHMNKPRSWQLGHPEFEGTQWMVKNILELKAGRRVTIEGNVLENNWDHGQSGYAVLFTPRADGQPQVVEDVVFQRNIVRRSVQGIDIMGEDDNSSGGSVSRRITIRDNVFYQIGSKTIDGRFILSLSTGDGLVIDHNTSIQPGAAIAFDVPRANAGFRFTNNLVSHGDYGIFGSGSGIGMAAIARYVPAGILANNAIILGPGQNTMRQFYAQGNIFTTLDEVKFIDPKSGNYGLSPTSKFKKAGADGKDIGADYEAVMAAAAGVAEQTGLPSKPVSAGKANPR